VVRTVRTFLPVSGEPAALAAAFEGEPSRWLPAARREGPDVYALKVRAGSLSRTVEATMGQPWQAGATHWRTLSWDPVGVDADAVPLERLLPCLDGEIGLHVESQGRVTLVLDARYQPPGGPIGTAVDTVALGRIARSTVERFLGDVASQLSAEALLIADVSPPGDTPGQ